MIQIFCKPTINEWKICDQSAAMLPFLLGVCERIPSLDVLFESLDRTQSGGPWVTNSNHSYEENRNDGN